MGEIIEEIIEGIIGGSDDGESEETPETPEDDSVENEEAEGSSGDSGSGDSEEGSSGDSGNGDSGDGSSGDSGNGDSGEGFSDGSEGGDSGEGSSGDSGDGDSGEGSSGDSGDGDSGDGSSGGNSGEGSGGSSGSSSGEGSGGSSGSNSGEGSGGSSGGSSGGGSGTTQGGGTDSGEGSDADGNQNNDAEGGDSVSDETMESLGEIPVTGESVGAESTSAIEETETTAVTEPDPVPDPAPTAVEWLLFGIVLVLAAICAWLALKLRKAGGKTPAAKPAGAAPLAPADAKIGVIHCQGARESQQDSYAVSSREVAATHGVLALVADGMGGLANGDQVSQAVISAMTDSFFNMGGTPEEILLGMTEMANQRVNQLLGPQGIKRGGSTLVAGLARSNRFFYVSIGDSRICLYRDGQLIQLNREHVYVHDLQLQALNGGGNLLDAPNHQRAAGLTSYLGMGQLKYVDIPAQPVKIRGGDKFILMSDGVYNALKSRELSDYLEFTAEEAAKKIEQAISDKAYPNQDNFTAVILEF